MPVTSHVTCHMPRESTAPSPALWAPREEPSRAGVARHRFTRSSLRQCSRRSELSARCGLQFRECRAVSRCDPLAVKTLSLDGAAGCAPESATMHYTKLPLAVQMALILDTVRCKSPRYRILVNADSLPVSVRGARRFTGALRGPHLSA